MIQALGLRFLSLLALVGLGLAGCSTPRHYAEYRGALEQAEQALAAGEYQRTIQPMRELLAQSAEEPGVYELQRFFAQALIAQATIEAGFDQPFLTQPRPVEASFGGGSKESANMPSFVAHLVAGVYEACYAIDWADAKDLAKSPATVDGEELLPASISSLGLENTRFRLDLFRLAAFSRLGFHDRVAQALESPKAAELTSSVESCEAAFARAHLSPQLHSRVYEAVFHFHKPRPEIEGQLLAYSFGVKALDCEARGDGQLDRDSRVEIETWITGNPDYTFLCPKHRSNAFDPTVDRCALCTIHRIDFTIERKPPTKP